MLTAQFSMFVFAAAFAAPVAPPFSSSYTPPFHGGACTAFSGWESFTQPFNASNAPDDPNSTATTASVMQTVAGGVITAAGNIDNLTNPPKYRVTDSVPADLQEVVLQVSIQLNQMNWSSIGLTYIDASNTSHTLAPTSSSYLVFQMGHEERLVRWDLSAVADTVLAYQIDFAANNSFTTLDAVKLDARWSCSPGVAFCHPGTGGVIPCPCANPPAGAAQGCDNSSLTGGASLVASGVASLANDTLHFTTSGEKPTAMTILVQGSQTGAAGIAFGQGVRCVTGSLSRLYSGPAAGGSISVPQLSDPTVSARSAAVGDVLSAGVTRFYMAYYRDPIVLGSCPPSKTFNTSDAVAVTWLP
jgi:hypothetical protein